MTSPTPIPLSNILIDDISTARQKILKYGVAVYVLKEISKETAVKT